MVVVKFVNKGKGSKRNNLNNICGQKQGLGLLVQGIPLQNEIQFQR